MKLNPAYKGRSIEGAGGTRLFVEEQGDPGRPTILWIHGYCQSRLCWDRQFENEELAAQSHQVRLDLQRITLPALILQGQDDRVILPAASDYLARHIPHAWRVDYEHCGHMPFVEVAEQFHRETAAFLQRVCG